MSLAMNQVCGSGNVRTNQSPNTDGWRDSSCDNLSCKRRWSDIKTSTTFLNHSSLRINIQYAFCHLLPWYIQLYTILNSSQNLAWFSADLVSYGIIEPGLELCVLPRLDWLGVGPLLEEAPDDGAQRVQVVHPLDDAGCLVQGDYLN